MTDEKKRKQLDEGTRQVLDAKIEALWQLGEPRKKPTMRVTGPIPVVSDIEQNTAHEAVQAIAEKYGIGQHDLYMFRRAHLLEIYHALGIGCPIRLELSVDIIEKIKWQ